MCGLGTLSIMRTIPFCFTRNRKSQIKKKLYKNIENVLFTRSSIRSDKYKTFVLLHVGVETNIVPIHLPHDIYDVDVQHQPYGSKEKSLLHFR